MVRYTHTMKLRQHRLALRLTLDEFGALIGVSGEAVRKWEAGERIPRRTMMQRIHRVTGGAIAPADFYASAPQQDERAAA